MAQSRTNVLRVALWLTVLAGTPAYGLPRYGPLEVSGNISAQNELRHRDVDKWDFVQQRNTAKIRVDYQLIDKGKLIDKYNLGFLKRAKFFLLYRGVYDSIYDLTPGFVQDDIWQNPIPQRLDTIENRAALRWENRLREAYIDFALKELPLSFRVGRQQIVWGETDNFRMLDRTNSLDMTWHLQQESWDELRIPYWMIKGLWDLNSIGPLSNVFVEAYWNPGDWYPAKKDFLPRPWSAPIVDPFNDNRGTPGPGTPDRGLNTQLFVNTGLRPPGYVGPLYHGTKLFGQGDYSRDPGDNSQVGVRFNAVTPQGIQFTLNYFYQRWAGDDGTNAASFSAVTNKDESLAALQRGEMPIVAVSPYVHVAGLSLNYSDDDYTQGVFRAETIYEMGVPFNDASKQYEKPNTNDTALKVTYNLLANDIYGVSKHDMWKGMIAYDRPTWIRFLNKNTTILLLGQFFWHYLLDNPEMACKNPKEPLPCVRSGQGRGLRGQFATSGFQSSGIAGTPPPNQVYVDKVRDWEALVTLAATTFYSGGKLVPLLVYVLDPVNKYNQEVLWTLDYYYSNDIIFQFSQKYFINTTDRPVFEGWGVGGINRGRSETGVRLTYQF